MLQSLRLDLVKDPPAPIIQTSIIVALVAPFGIGQSLQIGHHPFQIFIERFSCKFHHCAGGFLVLERASGL